MPRIPKFMDQDVSRSDAEEEAGEIRPSTPMDMEWLDSEDPEGTIDQSSGEPQV